MIKKLKLAGLSLLCPFIFSGYLFSQIIPGDTILANKYFDLAKKYERNSKLDSAIYFAHKAQELDIKYFGEKSVKNANDLHFLGVLYFENNIYNQALEHNLRALQIRKDVLGEKHLDVANSYNNLGLIYWNKGEFDNALESFLMSLQIRKELLGEKNPEVATSYDYIGLVYWNKGDYDKALENLTKDLKIRIETLGSSNSDVASSYNNIGLVYYNKGELNIALEYILKALQIKKEIFGENNTDVASGYNNIGVIYFIKGEYNNALEYHFKALQIRKEILGENKSDVAISYNNIGLVFEDKGEYDKALEYYLQALQIFKEIYGDRHSVLVKVLSNIGNIYYLKNEYNKALEYNFSALQIRKEILGEKHSDIANNYSGIGLIYYDKCEYIKALEYQFKALQIRREFLGEKHPDVANNYNNIGLVFFKKGEYDTALVYHFRALSIYKEILGGKNPDVARSYIYIGNAYSDKSEYNIALMFYQKGVTSCIYNFNDSINSFNIPVIRSYLNWNYLLHALLAKAEIISNRGNPIYGISNDERKKIALLHFQACDTLIDKTRKEITTQSDKLTLGEQAGFVCKGAIDLLIPQHLVDNKNILKIISAEDQNLAHYFSEKNKSSVLLEALAGQEAQKFAGIPDSLMQKEHNLKTDIARYSKKLAEPETLDSTQVILFQDRLFNLNRNYDSLIIGFEKRFPEYYNLKYNSKPATVTEIQGLIDKKTALISYFTGDSTITIFTITKDNLYINKVQQIKNLNDSIAWFRYSLTNSSPRMQQGYRRLGHKLYLQLFPNMKVLNKQIENLYIIPDGALSTLPFESLLTENYSGDINAYNNYPYLIRKYNISYSYSATLFHLTFTKQPSSSVEISKLNDWIAFAPVFENYGDQNVTLSSGELVKQLGGLKTDSLMVSRSVYDRRYIEPLPGTETETESIFKLFDDNSLKAKVLLHNNATENSIKSNETEQYRILHFATHGFVNSERPELSCLLMARDTTGKEDGILYSGEIYNLNLNADLVVLSACETGLGKIQKGEGIIGLTRALLYAGAKNIIVSLWRVVDVSTADLMVDFYKNSLTGKDQTSYSNALRNAKLKMISEGKYAHPMFWSPFILIGK